MRWVVALVCLMMSWAAAWLFIRAGQRRIDQMMAAAKRGPRMPHEGDQMFKVTDKDGNEVKQGDTVHNRGGAGIGSLIA